MKCKKAKHTSKKMAKQYRKREEIRLWQKLYIYKCKCWYYHLTRNKGKNKRSEFFQQKWQRDKEMITKIEKEINSQKLWEWYLGFWYKAGCIKNWVRQKYSHYIKDKWKTEK